MDLAERDLATATQKVGEIRRMAERLSRDQFPDSRLDRVEVKPDLGWKGDPILWVSVVFDVPVERLKLDVDKTSAFTGMMRSRLEEMDIEAFPVMSFSSNTSPEPERRIRRTCS